VQGDPLATDQSQPTLHHTSHFTTSQSRTLHLTLYSKVHPSMCLLAENVHIMKVTVLKNNNTKWREGDEGRWTSSWTINWSSSLMASWPDRSVTEDNGDDLPCEESLTRCSHTWWVTWWEYRIEEGDSLLRLWCSIKSVKELGNVLQIVDIVDVARTGVGVRFVSCIYYATHLPHLWQKAVAMITLSRKHSHRAIFTLIMWPRWRKNSRLAIVTPIVSKHSHQMATTVCTLDNTRKNVWTSTITLT